MNVTLVQRLAPLLCVVQRCEELARDVSMQQAAVAPMPRLARALRHQSRQEAFHSNLFQAALQCIPGRHRCPARLGNVIAGYQSRLQADLRAGDLLGSMFGLQCAFEGLAAVALQPPPGPIAAVCDRLIPLRALILRQEEAHHRIGHWWTARLAADGSPRASGLDGYVDLAREVAEAGLQELHALELDPAHYRPAIEEHLAAVQASRSALEGALLDGDVRRTVSSGTFPCGHT